MKFRNEKEFEFNVYKDLNTRGIRVRIQEEPFDSRIGNRYVELKMSKWNPKYHHPMIEFTSGQTVAMLNGKLPIVLVCGADGFYLLSKRKLKAFVDRRRKWKHIWISEKYFQDMKMTYDQLIESLTKRRR